MTPPSTTHTHTQQIWLGLRRCSFIGVGSCAGCRRAFCRARCGTWQIWSCVSDFCGKSNVCVCIRIPPTLWSLNATRLLSATVIFMNPPFVHVKWEKILNIKIVDGAESGFKVLQAVASWCLLGLKVVLICSCRNCSFSFTELCLL